jgi:hypothetical protein
MYEVTFGSVAHRGECMTDRSDVGFEAILGVLARIGLNCADKDQCSDIAGDPERGIWLAIFIGDAWLSGGHGLDAVLGTGAPVAWSRHVRGRRANLIMSPVKP